MTSSTSASGARVRVLGIAGSLRHDSYNRRLLLAAIDLAPDDVEFERFDLRGVPLFDADVEAQGDPVAVVRLKRAIARSDGLLIATPEYNHGIPGVLKNAIDWASRPAKGSVLRGKHVALMGASPGRSGAAGGITDAASALEAAGGVVLERTVGLARIGQRIDDEHALVDPEARDQVATLVGELTTVLRRATDAVA